MPVAGEYLPDGNLVIPYGWRRSRLIDEHGGTYGQKTDCEEVVFPRIAIGYHAAYDWGDQRREAQNDGHIRKKRRDVALFGALPHHVLPTNLLWLPAPLPCNAHPQVPIRIATAASITCTNGNHNGRTRQQHPLVPPVAYCTDQKQCQGQRQIVG